MIGSTQTKQENYPYGFSRCNPKIRKSSIPAFRNLGKMAESEKKEWLGCFWLLWIIAIIFVIISSFSKDDEKWPMRAKDIEKDETVATSITKSDWLEYQWNGFLIKFPSSTAPTVSRKWNNVLYSSIKDGINYAVGEINFDPWFINSSAKEKNNWLENHYVSQSWIKSFRQTRYNVDGSESMEFSYFNSWNSNITIWKTYVAKKNMYFVTTTFPSNLKSWYTDSNALAFRKWLKMTGVPEQIKKTEKTTGIPWEKTKAVDKCLIKGNIWYSNSEKIYHLPWDPFYEATVINTNYGERWFCSEKEAIAAWWRHANSWTNNTDPLTQSISKEKPFQIYQEDGADWSDRWYYDDYGNDDPYEDYQEEEEPEPNYYDDSYDSYDGWR